MLSLSSEGGRLLGTLVSEQQHAAFSRPPYFHSQGAIVDSCAALGPHYIGVDAEKNRSTAPGVRVLLRERLVLAELEIPIIMVIRCCLSSQVSYIFRQSKVPPRWL